MKKLNKEKCLEIAIKVYEDLIKLVFDDSEKIEPICLTIEKQKAECTKVLNYIHRKTLENGVGVTRKDIHTSRIIKGKCNALWDYQILLEELLRDGRVELIKSSALKNDWLYKFIRS